MTQQKTYKREIAVAMLAYYFAALTASYWYPEFREVAESVKIPAFTFAAGAFALDVGAKQWSQRS